MRWADGYIAADWGTTNRRAYLIDASGECVREFEDGKGILSVPKDGFDAAVAEIHAQLGEKPMLLAGMVGSNRGWKEARYVPCPAGLEQLSGGIVWVDERHGIVPGVCFSNDVRADVMRGEEVQLLGAIAAGMIPNDCTVCHPGTHNKWINLVGGRIVSFRTVMTGELFNLLRKHSILSDLLAGEVTPGDAFLRGVSSGFAKEYLQSELFGVRAAVLLGKAPAANAASYTSGLLIGGDVRIGLADAAEGPIVVMARPELTELYATAIRAAGREAVELDGERTFLAGARRLAGLISQ
ncbi:MAG: 2-dehydro-3-deoxygalactonokinase [Sphingomicrobium sp.]